MDYKQVISEQQALDFAQLVFDIFSEKKQFEESESGQGLYDLYQ